MLNYADKPVYRGGFTDMKAAVKVARWGGLQTLWTPGLCRRTGVWTGVILHRVGC